MQAVHLRGSTRAAWPPISKYGRARIVAARPAAAWSWAIVSSMNRGEWASPQTNTPSLARSTGRSLGCASRKKPSAVSDVLRVTDSARLSAGGGDALRQDDTPALRPLCLERESILHGLRAADTTAVGGLVGARADALDHHDGRAFAEVRERVAGG